MEEKTETKEVTPPPAAETEKKVEAPAEVVKKEEKDVPQGVRRDRSFNVEEWKPTTRLGKIVKAGKIESIDEILDNGMTILEAGVVDALVPDLQNDLLAVGQSKGKFGGGKPSIWRQTQKKTKEGNKPSFSALAIVGNGNGYVGIGLGKAKETVPAREKATRKAKLNLIKVVRGSGSWEGISDEPHSIPFKVTGKCGSIKVTLMPAPKGKGLVAEKECQKILRFAGIKDVYVKTRGHTATKVNLLKACFEALKQLSQIRISETQQKRMVVEKK